MDPHSHSFLIYLLLCISLFRTWYPFLSSFHEIERDRKYSKVSGTGHTIFPCGYKCDSVNSSLSLSSFLIPERLKDTFLLQQRMIRTDLLTNTKQEGREKDVAHKRFTNRTQKRKRTCNYNEPDRFCELFSFLISCHFYFLSTIFSPSLSLYKPDIFFRPKGNQTWTKEQEGNKVTIFFQSSDQKEEEKDRKRRKDSEWWIEEDKGEKSNLFPPLTFLLYQECFPSSHHLLET